jgi:hypothetical protein
MKVVGTVSFALSGILKRFAFCALLLPTGCTQLNTTRTGYLSDYSQLQKQDESHSLLHPRIIEAGGSGLEAFGENIDSFLIEPVAWKVGDVAPGSKEESYQLNLSTQLRRALIDELRTVRKIVEFPGPHTATVRAAVTNVALARPILNTALSIVAVPVFNGGGVVEAEVKAPDGRQIAVVVAALPGRATDVLGFFTWQGHAETAMRRSAAQLKSILTQTAQPKPAVMTLVKNRVEKE